MKAMLFRQPLRPNRMLASKTRTSGFSLIEMLIALVIFVIALLAIGLLQLRGIALTRDANMRTTAIFAARSMGEAIKANFAVNYALAPTNVSPAGQIAAMAACPVVLARGISSTNICVCTRARADIEEVFNIATNLPNPLSGGKIAVRALPMLPDAALNPISLLAPGSCDALEGQSYLVTVRWAEGTGAIGIQDQEISVVVMP